MLTITKVGRAAPAALAGALLLSAAIVFVAPDAVQAQDCVTCMEDAFWPGHGMGQPGGGLDCVSSPSGASDCFISGRWCSLEGECEELSHLDFGEDGTAYIASASNDPSTHHLADANQHAVGEPRRTCDGVLLRATEPDITRDSPRGEPVLTL